MLYIIKQQLHVILVKLAMHYLNTADLIAMVDTKLVNTQSRAIAIADLNYIVNKYH